MFPFLTFLLGLPLFGALVLACIPSWQTRFIKTFALWVSCVNFVLSLGVWLLFDTSSAKFQFVEQIGWLPFLNMNVYIGIDGISLFFIVLTTFLVPVCLLVGWVNITKHVKEYCIAFLLLETCMLAVFCMLDLLLFYVFFESVLLPMFLIIGVWGSRARKIRAAYQFFLYTLIGSVLMLLALLLIYFQVGTTDLQVLFVSEFSERRQLLLWLAFFASFAVKVPMVPMHIWLPEAHVEAPTAGSVILAGILLKLGTYGFVRFSIPLFPEASLYFTPLIYTMSIIGIIYASLTTLRQIDLKKIIAYSSVAHMGFVTIGLFSLNVQGIEGAILLMLSHGFVASALFLCVGTFQTNTWIATLAATGMILGGAYSIWLYNRVVFGSLKPVYISVCADVNRREFWLFVPFVLAIVWMGVYPDVFLEPLHVSVANVIQHKAYM